MTDARAWQETYYGGSQEAEEELFLSLAKTMLEVQERHRKEAGLREITRTLYSKTVVGLREAVLKVDTDIPVEFSVRHFQPGAVMPAALRMSNASGVPLHDAAPDLRGIAIRLTPSDGVEHDLLLASEPVSVARDARQYVDFIVIGTQRENQLAQMRERFGESEARRMVSRLKRSSRLCASFAFERFWSCGAVLWGTDPVRFDLRPDRAAAQPRTTLTHDPNALRQEFLERLSCADVRYRLALQRYVDETRTPIEDGSVEWREEVSPAIEIATLVVHRRTPDSVPHDQQMREVAALAFNPWNAPPEFRPLGNLNRARDIVYRASSHQWTTKSDPPA